VFSRSQKTGNVLSATGSQGLRETRSFGSELSETGARSSGKCAPEPEGHFVPESPASAGTKGQPEGSAIKSRTGKPGVAKPDRKTCNATGRWEEISFLLNGFF
jgi:hypothetical protein